MKLQLHRVGLDGKGDRRLTDPAFHHPVDLAPGRQALRRHRPDATTCRAGDAGSSTADGKVVAELAKSDTERSSSSWA